MEKLEIAQSIRLKSSQVKKLDEAAKKLALPKQDVIRLAIDCGLEHLKRINFDLGKAIVDCVEK